MALGTAGTLVAAAVVAGAVGAGTVLLLGNESRSPSPAAPPADGVASLQDRLDRQEKEIAALRARLEEKAAAREASSLPVGSVIQEEGELQLFDPATLTALSGPAADASSMPPEERAKYEAVYRAMREKEQEESRKARVAAFETGLRGRIDRIPASVGLTAEQKDAVVKILMARSEKLRVAAEEARAAVAAGGTDALPAAQEKREAIRREASDALAQALTVDQVKAVEDAADRGGPGGRGRFEGGARRTPR